MTMYTSRLIVIPNYGNLFRSNSSSNSSYSFQHERFRSTLIVLPNTNRKRFIQGIEVRCGSYMNDPRHLHTHHFKSLSPVGTTSDLMSADESICELYPIIKTPVIGESYFDVRHRLLAKSNLFNHTIKDDTDVDDNDSFCYSSSMEQSYHHGNYQKKHWH
ncbi:unnamed protein product [Adineta steineri]|uniref:Uncharacterized protein n=1 Tax=Adineta steineri TaxID=433720 RepID=A0A814ECV9_9BILA|nr:unnamed protein product [Adineta steineri]CAF0968548.1 unnamed protein product [Adineta steineri]CAF1092131.1 unnamed protein product [Adineta steineri]